MLIQHNISALNSHRRLGTNNIKFAKALEKLSSGYRINTAADDAAGLAISEKMRGQITGLSRAVLNANDGMSLVQTAEGALQEIHAALNRLEQTAVQSANGIYSEDDRQKLQAETDALLTEFDRISKSANFNGIPLLDGSLSRHTGISGAANSQLPPPYATPMAASGLMTPFALTPPPKTPPAGAATFTTSGSTITITGGGVFALDGSFAGKKIVVSTTEDVMIDQSGHTAAINNLQIECGAGSSLFVKNLNLTVSAQTRNIIRFTGAGNSLHVVGSNTLRSTIHDYQVAYIQAKEGTELTVHEADTSGPNRLSIGRSDTGHSTYGACIGGDTAQNGGAITINGGVLDFVTDGAAGIGGGYRGTGGNIVINDGNITGRGGNASIIGGGFEASGGNITINGGSLDVSAGKGAAIGGGAYFNGGSSGNITINGGDIKARSGEGTAIGAGRDGDCNKIVINGGTIYADGWRSGIGGRGGEIEISGGNVTAIGEYGAGIGGGSGGTGSIAISGGTINATSSYGAGIGGDNGGDGRTVVISGGSVTAKSEKGADIGAGRSGSAQGTLEVSGGGVHATNIGPPVSSGGVQPVYRLEVGSPTFGPEETVTFSVNGGPLQQWVAGPDGLLVLFLAPGQTKLVIEVDPDEVAYKLTMQPDHKNRVGFKEDEPPKPGKGLVLQIGSTADGYNMLTVYIEGASVIHLGLSGLSLQTQESASVALNKINNAIERVSVNRCRLGAYQNRLEHTISNLNNTVENLTAAESRIRDADMAGTMMDFTKLNVLAQAAQAMLAQANLQPQQVLQLLR